VWRCICVPVAGKNVFEAAAVFSCTFIMSSNSGQSSAPPALAPSGAAAAELQPQPDAQPALAPSGAAAEQPLFLEAERGDGGQRWVDLNIASGEDIWGLFLSPGLNGCCYLFVICCTASI
jgi:hypothetical protein